MTVTKGQEGASWFLQAWPSRAAARIVLLASGALCLQCGGHTPHGSRSEVSTGGGVGADFGSPDDAGGTGGTGETGGSPTAPAERGAAGPSAEAGAAGSSPREDDPASCEPKLRAVVSSGTYPSLYYVELVPVWTFEYDDSGRLRTVGDARPHSEFYATRYTYDDQDRIIEVETECDDSHFCEWVDSYAYYEDGTLMSLGSKTGARGEQGGVIYVYDEQGRIIELRSVEPTGEQTIQRFSFRSDGQPESLSLEQVDASGNESLIRIDEYTYDSSGRLNTVERKDGAGNLQWIEEYSYDAADRLISVVTSNGDGDLLTLEDYTYDTAGRLLSWEKLDPTGYLLADLSRTYDEDGRLLHEAGSEDWGGFWYTNYAYDEEGELQRIEGTSEDNHWLEIYESGRLVYQDDYSYSYLFDDSGEVAFLLTHYEDSDTYDTGFVGGQAVVSQSIGSHYFYALPPNSGLRQYPSRPHLIRPFDFAASEVSDFAFALDDGHEWARRYHFDDEGLVDRIELWFAPLDAPLEIDVNRGDGIVTQTARAPDPFVEDVVTVFYYGCDDFVLPDLE